MVHNKNTLWGRCFITSAFSRVWLADLLYKLTSYGISGQILGLIFFFSNRQLRVLCGNSSQEYPVNVGVPKGSILGTTLFLLYIIDLPDDVICNSAIYADTMLILRYTLYWKFD